MSQYINLDDPEVEYYLNFGHSEVYIVTPEAERIDLVRCGECKWASVIHDDDDNSNYFMCGVWSQPTDPSVYCSWAERREDG